MKVYGRPITQEDLNLIASYMDDSKRELVHTQFAPCPPEQFLLAYLVLDPKLMQILEREFEFEM